MSNAKYNFLIETKQIECYCQLYVDNLKNFHNIIKLEFYVGKINLLREMRKPNNFGDQLKGSCLPFQEGPKATQVSHLELRLVNILALQS